ncbi:adenine phosphoribosyltransferase [Entomospira nematocerorum]|uniref:Adenine phosphoribosyltransferase n=1 Tax=Entomospira nematocerorum TaxID=2719987 RepID=A0A968KYB3_9SPIO|nr:adenine phosphoribosyltransferase [Entomospira nematocera]NIZ47402.1 adenine phosphoribosyltransferase [Entomospira nematocera]WDI34058.1 adenine phosphoribosyltransferase [Entomospira nematocera]
MSLSLNLDTYIGKIPNFPKEGILFYDVTPMLQAPEALQFIVDQCLITYKNTPIDGIAALEARGFYFGTLIALAMNKPFFPIRKAGKLPGSTIQQSYDLEYGTATIEMQVTSNLQGKHLLIVDDLIATGGTLQAAAQLLEQQGAIVQHLFGIIGLSFLNYRKVLQQFTIQTLINYDKETI